MVSNLDMSVLTAFEDFECTVLGRHCDVTVQDHSARSYCLL